jgi:4-amino-4-deoxy-L-arabinose transferase-like glycosyltransferase
MTDDTSARPLAKLDDWLKSHRRGVLIVVMLLASVVRITAFVELHESPVMQSYKYDQMDMQFFDMWAVKIATTDPAGVAPFHPIHMWHRLVARSQFEAHPELIGGRNPAELGPEEASAATLKLWHDWYLGARFHQEPLYVYVIAALYWLNGGPDARLVYGLQLLGGIVTVLLLFLVSRRLFGDLVAVLTALLVTWWAPLIHYEVTLLRTSLITMMGVILLYAGQRAIDRRDAGTLGLPVLFGYGCLIGVATTLKTTFLLFAGGMVLAMFWPQRRNPSQVLKRGVVMLVGIALILLPVIVRNAYVGAPLFSMTSVAAVTFAASNVPGYDPAMGWYPYDLTPQIAKILHEGRGSFLSALVSTVGMHDGLFGYLGLLWRKFLLIWHWFEIPNNTNCYYSTLHSTVLMIGRHIVSSAWILPAGVIGCVIAVGQRRKVGTWVWYLACSIGPMVVFYVLSRFRAPMMVALMPFAAFAVVQIVEWCLTRRPRARRLAVGTALVFVVFAWFVNRDTPRGQAVIAAGCYGMAFQEYYNPQINAARERGDARAAVEIFQKLNSTEPDYVQHIGIDREIRDIGEATMIDKVCLLTYPYYQQCLLDAGESARAQQVGETIRRFRRALAEYSARQKQRPQK